VRRCSALKGGTSQCFSSIQNLRAQLAGFGERRIRLHCRRIQHTARLHRGRTHAEESAGKVARMWLHARSVRLPCAVCSRHCIWCRLWTCRASPRLLGGIRTVLHQRIRHDGSCPLRTSSLPDQGPFPLAQAGAGRGGCGALFSWALPIPAWALGQKATQYRHYRGGRGDLAADLDFLKHLDLLEEVDVLEQFDTSL